MSTIDLASLPTTPAVRVQSHWPVSLALMFASGFAGLGYQVVWTQQGSLWLGHEAAAVLAVVAAFFGGLAVGAWVFGSRIERSPDARRWYAACELVIAGWGVALAVLMPQVTRFLLVLMGTAPGAWRQWGVAFVGMTLLLLPATLAMGATLPAMERIAAGWRGAGRSIGAPYAANTLGAMVGVLVAAFWFVPAFGLVRTASLCALVNVACAGVALFALPRGAGHAARAAGDDARLQRGRLGRLALTGLLGVGYEVLVIRVLSQVTEDTVYTFAMLLAVYLAGTGLGAAAHERWFARDADADRLGDRLLRALAVACLLGLGALWGADAIKQLMTNLLGDGMAPAIAIEATLAVAAFALPTFVMGALFSHLSAQAHRAGASFGRALGVNTLGAAFAPLIFGVWLAPAIGPSRALLVGVLGYALLVSRDGLRKPSTWLPAGVAVGLLVLAPPLAFIDIPAGGRLVHYAEGANAAVSVVEDAAGVSRLRIDNRQQEGSSATGLVDGRQALLPILLHPRPKRVLFLGLGTGVTASTAAADQTLQVEAVELLPEVIEASAWFRRGASLPTPAGGGLQVVAVDARRFVVVTPAHYDVVVADNFHPARSGSGALYTVEHFRAVRERLAPGGLFCQWLPLHQLDLATVRSIVRSFLAAYPDATAMLASNSLDTPVLGLIGRRDAERLDVETVARRLADTDYPVPLARFGIDDVHALLGSFVAGPASLERFANSAPLNTDDRPVVAYDAPRITYAPDSRPRDRLVALLHEWRVTPLDVLAAPPDAAAAQRLAAYWRARDAFIEAGLYVQPTANAADMLAQVRAPLMNALRISPDFRPAYDPLLRMAEALATTDPNAARQLFDELATVAPERTEAAARWRRLADSH